MNKVLFIRSKITIYATIIAISILAAVSAITFQLFSAQLKHAVAGNQYQNLSSMAVQLIAVFALLGVVAGLVMWLVMGKIMSPLQSIIDHIGSIQTKSGDERFLPNTIDGDLGRLSSAFNKMVAEFDLQQEILILMQSEMEQQKVFAEGILEKAAVPIIVLDVNHRITVWNNAVEDLTGLLSDEMIGTSRQWLPFYESERPVLADLVLSGYESHLEKLYGTYRMSQHVPGGLQAEGWFENVGGQRRYLLFDAAPVFDSNNVMLGVIETLLDITDRKQAEAELSRSRENLQLKHNELEKLFDQVAKGKRDWEDTMDSLSEMVLVCDPSGVVTRCNRAVTTFTGLSYNEIIFVDYTELFAMVGLKINDYVGSRGSGQMGCEGDLRHFELISNEMKQIGTEKVRGFVVTIHETTELHKMNENLQKAYAELQQRQAQVFQQEKMASIGQLAAGVAHEINNPLGFISSNLTTLNKYVDRLAGFIGASDQALTSISDIDSIALTTLKETRKKLKIDYIMEDSRQLIAENLDGVGRVRRIVQDLKSFSRVDHSEQALTNLNEALETTINIAWNEIKYIASLNREFGDIPEILCFPQQLNQVFLNLLVNAAHAMEDRQGNITVRTWSKCDHVFVSVADNGCGMPEEVRQRIFEPFFTTKEAGKGTGLGLSISYDIIRKHEGKITVDSEAGKGTTFTVELPVKGPSQELADRGSGMLGTGVPEQAVTTG
jgi:two-component system NtrC family sensor kinase